MQRKVMLDKLDLKIIKNLLTSPIMQVKDIAKYTSLSTKTVARWFERMKKHQILQFTIIRDNVIDTTS